jgi:hypothetical protein
MTLRLPPLSSLRLFEAAARCGGFLGEGLDLHSKKRRKPMLIRSTLIVATAIATLGLGSPAFAGGGDDSNDITTRTGGTLDTRPRRPPVQALKCHKMTGSGADRY